MVRLQSSSLKPSLSSCKSSDNHFQRLVQKTIEGDICKINWQRSWGSAVAQVGLFYRQAQIQGVSKSAAVAADCHLLTWGKCATTGAIYWLSLRVKIVLMLCKFWAVTSHWRQIFFYSAMKFSMELARTCYWPKLFSLRPWSFIDLWVKEGHRNKSTCSKLNPVQSSRSKLTTCPRKGRLLRFQSNRTAT